MINDVPVMVWFGQVVVGVGLVGIGFSLLAILIDYGPLGHTSLRRSLWVALCGAAMMRQRDAWQLFWAVLLILIVEIAWTRADRLVENYQEKWLHAFFQELTEGRSTRAARADCADNAERAFRAKWESLTVISHSTRNTTTDAPATIDVPYTIE